MTEQARKAERTFSELALDKLTRVLGVQPAQRVFAETLAGSGLTAISSADDLYAFGELLSAKGGFEAAVGAMLTVAAVMRGASAPGRRK